ncbi:MAG: hypothetical protein KatS3mg105_4666 [Gemmatales bacterium]|nr:MAG: hypothetical protein KatS3mg105_4666 [Gemmatales bacterium]
MLTDKAREQYNSGDVYWPAKLVLELEDKAPGKALHWAIECAKALVENTSPDKKEHFFEWLSELSLAQNNPDSNALMEKAQQIWHEERTRLNTAISHLYAALSYFAQENGNKYRQSLSGSLYVMGEHDFYRQTSLEIPLALFEKFSSDVRTENSIQ